MWEVWRDQGRMMLKRNTFTDFIACAVTGVDKLNRAGKVLMYKSISPLAVQNLSGCNFRRYSCEIDGGHCGSCGG